MREWKRGPGERTGGPPEKGEGGWWGNDMWAMRRCIKGRRMPREERKEEWRREVCDGGWGVRAEAGGEGRESWPS